MFPTRERNLSLEREPLAVATVLPMIQARVDGEYLSISHGGCPSLARTAERYRRRALAHLAATLQTLSTLDADMEELRAKVAAPEIDRLKERQTRASLGQGESAIKVLECEPGARECSDVF